MPSLLWNCLCVCVFWIDSISWESDPAWYCKLGRDGKDISLLFATGRYRHRQFNLKGSTAPVSPPASFYYCYIFFSLRRHQLSSLHSTTAQGMDSRIPNVLEAPLSISLSLIHTVFRSNKPTDMYAVGWGVPDVSYLEGKRGGYRSVVECLKSTWSYRSLLVESWWNCVEENNLASTTQRSEQETERKRGNGVKEQRKRRTIVRVLATQ